MQFDKTMPVFKVASRDESRYTCNSVHLHIPDDDRTAAKLVATDGRMLVAVGVQSIGDNDAAGQIPLEAMKEAAKGKKDQPATIGCNGAAELLDGRSYPRPEGNFPDWQCVVPKATPDDFTIVLDPFLLATLAEAMGAKADGKGVTLRFRRNSDGDVRDAIDPSCPIRVENRPGDVGVIMPIG